MAVCPSTLSASRSYCLVPPLVPKQGRTQCVVSPNPARCASASHISSENCSATKTIEDAVSHDATTRRAMIAAASAAMLMTTSGSASAVSSSRRALRETRIPESDYKTMNNGLKYYDLKVGGGKAAKLGDRVAIHYVVKWKGITFMTSRQGAGVTGGTPYGFDVGSSGRGNVLKGLDLGVEGMRVGGERQLIVPPELAYGNRGVQEIPPGATLQINVELLSIKQNAFGTPVKIVEG